MHPVEALIHALWSAEKEDKDSLVDGRRRKNVWGELLSEAKSIVAMAAKTIPPPTPSRFVEAKMAGGVDRVNDRFCFIAVDTIESIQYEPWCVILFVRSYTVDHRPCHVKYFRTFETEDKPEVAARAFIAQCTRAR